MIMSMTPTSNCPLVSVCVSRSSTDAHPKHDITKKLWEWLVKTFSGSNESYEDWRRLEYRNEMAGRLGEKMNPYHLR
jgi:hypothetical protein